MLSQKQLFTVPKIGMRNLKTAIAATLCALIYAIVDRNPTFACMSAVFAMNTNLKSSFKTGGNRLFGTIIGGFTGMLFFYLFKQCPLLFPCSKLFSESIFLFTGIIVMILISQFFGVNDSIPSGSVVFYIVMLLTPDQDYITYPLNRMLDTGIGVMMSILVNIALPRELFEKFMSQKALDDKILELERQRQCIDRSIDTHVAQLEALERRKNQS
ncbi:MAG: aromatic acid exporter family protein [Candidatus Fimivivens sp.]|nr:aromatic acid exporter family protein [Candidatus Fimivivens sp.]